MELTYKNVDKDIERWMEKYGVPDTLDMGPGIPPTQVLRGLDKAEEYVFDNYFKNKAYDALVAYVMNLNHISDYESPLEKRLNKALIADKQTDKLKRLWQTIISKKKLQYFEILAYHKKVPDRIPAKQVEEHKKYVIAGMQKFSKILEEVGDIPSSKKIIADLDNFKNNKKPDIKPTDSRKVDEKLFWDLIKQSSKSAKTNTEQIEYLIDALTKFKPAEIKAFNKILKDKMLQAYHWDLWALAYLAQDGCSDDSFEGFRAWLILQGEDVFHTALNDPDKAAKNVPSGLTTTAMELLSVPDIAHEKQTGTPLKPERAKTAKLKGKEWQEEELKETYPKLWKFYNKK